MSDSRRPRRVGGLPHRYRPNHSRIVSKRTTRWIGEPLRESSWLSAGKRTISTSRPSTRRIEKRCSPCSISQRRSCSECTIKSGVAAQTYTVTATSKSGNTFSITKAAAGTFSRDCTTHGQGSCKSAADANGNYW